MWKLLYKLASPQYFYNKTGQYLPFIAILAVIFLALGFLWGLVFAPMDYQQKDAFRILYVHVPTAFLSMFLYLWLGFLAILLLVWRIKLAGLLMPFVAQLGASMAFLALVTGAIWGKPMWGTWWVWDARLTSELILFFVYLSIFLTYKSLSNSKDAEKIIAILALIGLVDLPIIHYSVYWWNSLHQGSSLFILERPKIASSMLYPLLLTIVGFSLYCIAVILAKARIEIIFRERSSAWVNKYMEIGNGKTY